MLAKGQCRILVCHGLSVAIMNVEQKGLPKANTTIFKHDPALLTHPKNF